MNLDVNLAVVVQGLIVLGIAGIAKLQLSTAVALGKLSQRQEDHEKADDKVHDRVLDLEKRQADKRTGDRITALEQRP